MATASSSDGSASMMSIRRMISGPARFGEKPASRPRRMPGISEITTEDRPISSDRRAPWISREQVAAQLVGAEQEARLAAFQPGWRGQQEVAELLARIVGATQGRTARRTRSAA